MIKIDLPALEVRVEHWLLEQEDKIDGIITRWREWRRNEREGREWLAAMMPTDYERKHERWMAREEIRHQYPHTTDLGLNIILAVNDIRWHLEMVQYIIVGEYCKRWKDEIDRQEAEACDARLLSYAY